MYDPYADFTKHTLENGLEVHSLYWDRPWIKLEAVVHAGGREDFVGKSGLAHFVEHLVSENVLGHSKDSIIRFFESFGGGVTLGATGYCYTQYGFKIPADPDALSGALQILGAMLTGATLSNNIERERTVIEREFNERNPFKEKLEWSLDIRRALYPGHRLATYGGGPIGRPEEFLTVTEQHLQEFYDQYYTPANISLAIIGGVETPELIAALEGSPFATPKSGVRNGIPAPFMPPVPVGERMKVVRISDYTSLTIDQAEYRAIWAFPTDFPWLARRVFNAMLGTILFEDVREKLGLSYGFKTHVANYQDVCEYEISGSVHPSAIDSISAIVRSAIDKVPTRKDLFERKFNARKQSALMIDLSGGGLVDAVADGLAMDQRNETMQEYFDALCKVTFDQMAEVAALLSEDRKYTFITRP
jgi:predicted Zn-dependent peptidase